MCTSFTTALTLRKEEKMMPSAVSFLTTLDIIGFNWS